jgi:hypothetical protein
LEAVKSMGAPEMAEYSNQRIVKNVEGVGEPAQEQIE